MAYFRVDCLEITYETRGAIYGKTALVMLLECGSYDNELQV